MSVTHVVLIDWASEDAAVRGDVEERVRSLPAAVPEILDLVLGPNISPEGLHAGYAWGFVMRFAGVAERDRYLTHPAHLPVAALIGRAADRVVVFDI